MSQYEQRLYRYLYQLVGNAHDAEDLTQETFVKAHRDLHRYRAEHAFSTWIYTIAKRTAYTFLKRRRPAEPIRADMRIEDANPSNQLEARETQDSIWELARTLKPAWREALWLRYGEELSVAETAAVMETNTVRVRVILHRARNQLSRLLKQCGTGEQTDGRGNTMKEPLSNQNQERPPSSAAPERVDAREIERRLRAEANDSVPAPSPFLHSRIMGALARADREEPAKQPPRLSSGV